MFEARPCGFRLLNVKWIATGLALMTCLLLQSPGQAAELGWRNDLSAASREAARDHKSVLAVVGARWCAYCRQMEEQTLRDPNLMARIRRDFVPVKIDVDEQSAVASRLQAESLPTVLVLTPDQKVASRVTGFQSASQLQAQIAPFQSSQSRATSPRLRTLSPRTGVSSGGFVYRPNTGYGRMASSGSTASSFLDHHH